MTGANNQRTTSAAYTAVVERRWLRWHWGQQPSDSIQRFLGRYLDLMSCKRPPRTDVHRFCAYWGPCGQRIVVFVIDTDGSLRIVRWLFPDLEISPLIPIVLCFAVILCVTSYVLRFSSYRFTARRRYA